MKGKKGETGKGKPKAEEGKELSIKGNTRDH